MSRLRTLVKRSPLFLIAILLVALVSSLDTISDSSVPKNAKSLAIVAVAFFAVYALQRWLLPQGNTYPERQGTAIGAFGWARRFLLITQIIVFFLNGADAGSTGYWASAASLILSSSINLIIDENGGVQKNLPDFVMDAIRGALRSPLLTTGICLMPFLLVLCAMLWFGAPMSLTLLCAPLLFLLTAVCALVQASQFARSIRIES